MNKTPNVLLSKIKSLNFLLPPTLMVVFPILSFYLNNITELSLKFIGKPLLYSLILSLAGTLILSVIIKNKNKAALIVTLFGFIFFSYGHLSKSLNSKLFIQLPNHMVLGPDKTVLPAIILMFVFLVYKLIRCSKPLNQIIIFLNLTLISLVSYLFVLISNHETHKRSYLTVTTKQQGAPELYDIDIPDIYYIILDGYAREDVLQNVYHYDNSSFISNLRKTGFYVADSARSNYIHTYLSLPSSLNMRYLDDLPKKYGVKPVDGTAARQLVSDSEVVRKLRGYGYTIINFSSAWEGTNESFNADITYTKDHYFKILGKNVTLDETSIVYLQTTLLTPLINEIWGDALRAGTMTTLQKLPTIPYQDEKKFIMAHIIAPHPPYVFTANGDPVPGAEFEFADEGLDKRPRYLGQLTFISNQILPVVQKIIQNSPDPPIIILQADHGPGSYFGKRDDWLANYSVEGVGERSGILYAIYFPDHNYQQLYDTITPVNTFRIIFDQYFDENLELLPDKTFYTSYEEIYGFKDVTDIK